MKKTKLILLAMTCVAMLSLSSCDSKKTLTKEELPAAAQAYLQQNFPTANVLLVRQESEAFEGKEFEVKLDNGVELKFGQSCHSGTCRPRSSDACGFCGSTC